MIVVDGVYRHNRGWRNNSGNHDPSNLLKYTVRTSKKREHWAVGQAALRVKSIRDEFYGHVPELKITEDLVSRFTIGLSIHFSILIQDIDKLIRILR